TFMLLDEMDLLVEEGIYRDRESLIRDALRALLRAKPELRSRLALSLYRRGQISLARAAEISGMDMESFKELLGEAGVPHSIAPIGEETVRRETERLIRLRKGKD
ncbi:MAG: hypothetical protein D6759_06040, partial [Chloroflexi bacterium]